jgi:RNA polymerase sigma factor (sigma-70 family)
MDDRELLNAYVREGSEEAFAALVQRYLDLVYSAASRQLSNPDQAQDVTQAVFVMLSRKAGSISRRTVLSGWLYRTARYVALEAARAENRRRIREATMTEMSETTGSDSAPEAWKRIAPHLDCSMEVFDAEIRKQVNSIVIFCSAAGPVRFGL